MSRSGIREDDSACHSAFGRFRAGSRLASAPTATREVFLGGSRPLEPAAGLEPATT